MLSDKSVTYGESDFITINLHKYFDMKLKGIHSDSRILLIEYNEFKLGFFVDKIIEMITVDANIIQNIHTEVKSMNVFIKSMLKFNGKKFIIPDFDKIIACLKK